MTRSHKGKQLNREDIYIKYRRISNNKHFTLLTHFLGSHTIKYNNKHVISNTKAYIKNVFTTKIITYHIPHVVTTRLLRSILDTPWTVHT